jgi:hypothetical protein
MAPAGTTTLNGNEQFYNRLVLYFALPVLFIFSIVFNQERIYGDAAGYLFTMIHKSGFNIVHHRPSSVFVEWLPYIMIKLQMPLKYILLGFSISEFAYFATWYIILARVFKAPALGLGVVFAYLFGLRWNYFNPVSELILASPFLFLLAKLRQDTPKNKIVWYVANALIIVFVLLSHPLYSLLLPAVFGYFYLQRPKEKSLLFIGIYIIIIAALNYKIMAGYDKLSVEMVQYQMKPLDIIKKFFSIASIIDLLKAYGGILFLIALLAFNLYKEKRFVLLAYAGGFVLGYFALVAYKYGNYYPDTFEPFERYLFLIPVFISIAALPYLLKAAKKVRYIIVVLVVWHLFYLGKYGMFVQHRYFVLDNAISNARQFATNKVYYRAENYYCIMGSARDRGHDWVTPWESLLLSSLNGPEHTMQAYVKNVNPDEFYIDRRDDDYLYSYNMWLGRIVDLNQAYMHMEPGPWVEANTDSLQPAFDFKNISIQADGKLDIKSGKTKKVAITIINTGKVPLYSGMKHQRRGLGFRWSGSDLKETGKFITPLMCDVLSTVKQEVVITGPSQPGEYSLEIGYISAKPDTFIPLKLISK